MSKTYVYTANFTVTNELTSKNDPDVARDLLVLTDLSEDLSETLFDAEVILDIEPKMTSTTSGVVNILSPIKLTDQQLAFIDNYSANDINKYGLSDGIGEIATTVNGDGYTDIVWPDANPFTFTEMHESTTA